jgi:hypothetical protein
MTTTYIASASPLQAFIGICEPCKRPVKTASDVFMGDHYPAICPDCHKPVTLQRIYGTVSKMDCHPACQSAYGPICICGCGGINHGDVWTRTGEMLADCLAVYRADRARREAIVAKRRDARAAKAQAEFDAWRDANAALVAELTATDWIVNPYPNDFLDSMARIVADSGILTERQAEATAHTLNRRREVRERVAAEQAAREATATDVPTGRQVISGPIVNSWHWDGGDHGPSIKIKVDCGTYQVRGTCPKALIDETSGDWDDLPATLKGRHVTLTATLKPDGQELGQGYFNRPSKASFSA